ncbi:hypothetical protein JCM17380_33530 [Desulfosporosinus burensis]
MGSEKIKILEMIQEGKLTAVEGLELLKVIEEGNSQNEGAQIVGNGLAKKGINLTGETPSPIS